MSAEHRRLVAFGEPDRRRAGRARRAVRIRQAMIAQLGVDHLEVARSRRYRSRARRRARLARTGRDPVAGSAVLADALRTAARARSRPARTSRQARSMHCIRWRASSALRPETLPEEHEARRRQLAALDAAADLDALNAAVEKARQAYIDARPSSCRRHARKAGKALERSRHHRHAGIVDGGRQLRSRARAACRRRRARAGADRIPRRRSCGVPLRPLAKVASGGELARISLALAVIASAASPTPTLIFDEVDTGIGGGVPKCRAALHQLGREPPGAVRHALAASGRTRRSAFPGGEDQHGRGRYGSTVVPSTRRAASRKSRACSAGSKSPRPRASTRRKCWRPSVKAAAKARPSARGRFLPPKRHGQAPATRAWAAARHGARLLQPSPNTRSHSAVTARAPSDDAPARRAPSPSRRAAACAAACGTSGKPRRPSRLRSALISPKRDTSRSSAMLPAVADELAMRAACSSTQYCTMNSISTMPPRSCFRSNSACG